MALYTIVSALSILLLLHASEATRSPVGFQHKKPFKTKGPYVIGHRGAFGEFPESSAPGFKQAIENGVDFLETDIMATKDGYLVCLHDVILDAITDVANHTEFRDRLRTYEIYGINMTGYFLVDFTLKEIKTLRLNQRYAYRDHSHDGLYQILTFEEFLAIALNADRVVGIDPEIKNSPFSNKHVKWDDGKLLEDKIVETLAKYGFNAPYMSKQWLQRPIFIQTFAPGAIFRIVNQTQAPKIFNIGGLNGLAEGSNLTYGDFTTDEYLEYFGQYLLGVSVQKNDIAPVDSSNRLMPLTTDIVDRAHALGLQIHPAVYRNEVDSLPLDFKDDPYRELDFHIRKVGADAVIVDHVKTVVSYLKCLESGTAAELWG